MVTHRFICDCGNAIADHKADGVHICPKCGREMKWDLSGIGIPSGDYEHISDSLAMCPSQIAEHKAFFPDIDVLPDGRPRFTSVKQQDRYLKKTGFVKHTQKIRRKGERIA